MCLHSFQQFKKPKEDHKSIFKPKGKRLTQGCNHQCLKKAFSSVFKHVQTRLDSLYNRGAGKVDKCHSCGLIKDLNEDLTNAMRAVPSGSYMCVKRKGGREGRKGDTRESGKGVGC